MNSTSFNTKSDTDNLDVDESNSVYGTGLDKMEEKAKLQIENLGCTSQETLDEENDTGYLSDSSALEDLPRRRGRKRKDMCPDDAEKKRVTANFQERQRMLNLNSALDRLRACLPDQFKVGNRRTSKIRTLRLAASYIRSLGDLLKQDSIIRESMPPQPGFDPRLPSLNDVTRQGDGGEIYTPEKDISFPQQQDPLTHTTPDYRYPFYGHHQFGSSPHFNYSSHTTSSPLQQHPAFSQLPLQYLPMYPPQFYPRESTLSQPQAWWNRLSSPFGKEVPLKTIQVSYQGATPSSRHIISSG